MKEGKAMEREQGREKELKPEGRLKVFGIRHLSPAGAYYVREYLDHIRPEQILIEGPSDFTELIEELGSEEVKPPVAVMAYTTELPIRTILYPFAVYSPEYQAVLWAREHGCPCRFCDLPSEIFLGLSARRQAEKEDGGEPKEGESPLSFVYRRLDEQSDDGDSETFWERTMEHAADAAGYREGAARFGTALRRLSLGYGEDDEETMLREAYMRRAIDEAVKGGIAPE